MKKNPLYDHIRARNPDGLPHEDAVQIFLWLFCTTSVLPESLRSERITKEVLVDAFEKLTEDGLILYENLSEETVEWAGLVRELLSDRTQLDWSFKEKLGRYL